jgi:DNA polymerase delta subunit 1
VKDVVTKVLDKILIERSYEEAIAYCKKVISDLLQNRIDLSLLVITKGLGKKMKSDSGNDAGCYQSKQAHTELAAKMKKRDAATAPSAGDRVAFVMIKLGKGARGYEKSEDPLYALENNLPLDYHYYLENQLK